MKFFLGKRYFFLDFLGKSRYRRERANADGVNAKARQNGRPKLKGGGRYGQVGEYI